MRRKHIITYVATREHKARRDSPREGFQNNDRRRGPRLLHIAPKRTGSWLHPGFVLAGFWLRSGVRNGPKTREKGCKTRDVRGPQDTKKKYGRVTDQSSEIVNRGLHRCSRIDQCLCNLWGSHENIRVLREIRGLLRFVDVLRRPKFVRHAPSALVQRTEVGGRRSEGGSRMRGIRD
jgi:hypothetical protein